MGLHGEACVVGIAERPAERKFAGTPALSLEQWAGLAADALADAGHRIGRRRRRRVCR